MRDKLSAWLIVAGLFAAFLVGTVVRSEPDRVEIGCFSGQWGHDE